MDVPQYLGLFVLILGSAKVCGWLAQRIGQPTVLGELIAGVLLGASVFGLVDPHDHVLHVLAELGVLILLFEIGLETDLGKLLQVGGASAAVAAVGVALPFALGYAVCAALGQSNLVSIFAGASLTATSVGITARVLADLGRLKQAEGQIILGAAIIDDVVGLVILAVVSGLAGGEAVTVQGVATTTAIAFGFLVGTLVIGRYVVPPLARAVSKVDLPGTTTILALMLAFGLAWLAAISGSALIIGAFAAGLLLRETPLHEEIEHGVANLGHFFVPIFFVTVGAAVDLRVFNPLDPAGQQTLFVGGLLVVAALIGKFAAGYAPFWLRVDKRIIGVGMIPRGEVGLIFAQIGLATKVFDADMFSAIALMVMVTTFLAPPLLKFLSPPVEPSEQAKPLEGIEELVVGERE